jgi:uncharacterized membrane protein YhhN
LATLALIASERAAWRTGLWIFKPLASVLFVACGIASGGLGTEAGRWVVAGLVLGALGDVFLIPRSRTSFLVGLVIFLLGHLAYAVACCIHGADGLFAGGAGLALIVAAILAGRWLLPHVESKMKIPVLAYMAVISLMVAGAAGVYGHSHQSAWLVAAIVFYLSDLSVARDRFVAPGFINRAWGLPFYYGAQILFALTAAS